jgi:hypothetical protein
MQPNPQLTIRNKIKSSWIAVDMDDDVACYVDDECGCYMDDDVAAYVDDDMAGYMDDDVVVAWTMTWQVTWQLMTSSSGWAFFTEQDQPTKFHIHNPCKIKSAHQISTICPYQFIQ